MNGMAKYSEAQKRAVAKYQKANYDTICLRLPKGYRDDVLRPAAESIGESVHSFIQKAVYDRVDGLGKKSETDTPSRADDAPMRLF